MPIRVYYEVLNQKGTPALYSDNYASRPAAGYVGRIFYSPDTAQIFYDTGSTWTLLADAGVGSGSLASVCANGNTTATGISITAGGLSSNSVTISSYSSGVGQVFFASTGGLLKSTSNLFWDDTQNRLGIQNSSPGANLDIHGTGGTLVQLNGTGANNSYLQFQNAGVSKWRIGNQYQGGANSFGIYNNSLSANAMTIDSTSNVTFVSNVTAGSLYLANGINFVVTGGQTTITGSPNGISIQFPTTFSQTLTFPTGVGYTYTFPSATGTLALTSNLSSYLPLTGGTLSGALTINSTLYINPTNTGLTGLDVASNNVSFRSDNLEGSKRQLTLTMGSGTLIQFTAQGYGAARGTDLSFYTSAAGGVNSTPAMYLTGGNNIGFGTGSPFNKMTINTGTGNNLDIFDTGASFGIGMQAVNANNTGYKSWDFYASKFSFLNGNLSFGANSYTWQTGWTWVDQGTSGAIVCPNDGNYIVTANGYYNSGWKYKTSGYIGVIEYNSGGSGRVQVFTSNGSGTAGGSAALVSGPYVANAGISWTNGSSDARLKKNFETTQGLAEILQIEPVKYHFLWDNENDYKRLGFTAQNIQNVIPEMVMGNGKFDDNGNEYLTITPDYLLPVLVKAIQELNDKIENLN